MDGATLRIESVAELRTRIDHELALGWALYVATRGGAILGMLALKPHDAVLDQIFVHPDAQQDGVGRTLLATAQRLMRDGFTLRMSATNRRAARFYETAGLIMIAQAVHPRTGAPVHHYQWKPPALAPDGDG